MCGHARLGRRNVATPASMQGACARPIVRVHHRSSISDISVSVVSPKLTAHKRSGPITGCRNTHTKPHVGLRFQEAASRKAAASRYKRAYGLFSKRHA